MRKLQKKPKKCTILYFMDEPKIFGKFPLVKFFPLMMSNFMQKIGKIHPANLKIMNFLLKFFPLATT